MDEPNFQYNAARYGHTANVHNGGIYFFGGFNGVLYNDLFKFTPGLFALFVCCDDEQISVSFIV